MIDNILLTAAIIMMLAIFISAYRFIIGPDIVDRVISFDVMTVSSIAIIAIISSFFNRIIYLDIAIVYGILSFLSVIVVGRFLEKGM
jgi:multicomponent Na+:H+ antiporter subunit F